MSVSRRFWSLVCAILLATMLCSALAIWFTSTPFLEANQSKTIQDQAQKDARAFDRELAQYEQLLHFVAVQENVVSVVIGYVESDLEQHGESKRVSLPLPRKNHRKGHTVEVLHDDDRMSRLLEDLVRLNDVGVVQTSGQARFFQKHVHHRRIVKELAANRLEDD